MAPLPPEAGQINPEAVVVVVVESVVTNGELDNAWVEAKILIDGIGT